MRKPNISFAAAACALLCACLLVGCSKHDDTPTPPADDLLSPSQIAEVSQASWAAYIRQLQPAFEQSGETRAHIARHGFTTYDMWAGEQTHGTENVWQLPFEERMKTYMFFKIEPHTANAAQFTYPMFISLHGGGRYPSTSSAWGSMINEEQWDSSIALAREWIDAPAFYFVPRMADDRKGQWHYQPQVRAFQKAIRYALAQDLARPDEVYLLGISQGGYGVIHLAEFMPDYFAAVAPLDAAEEVTENIENLRHVGLYMKVAEKDYKYGRVQYAYKWQDRWQQLHAASPDDFLGQVVIEEGKRHGYLTYSDITPYLKHFKRHAQPSHITYIYHNVAPDAKENLFSEGVYNLDFRQLQAEDTHTRVRFDYRQEGNLIRLNTKALHGSIQGTLGIFLKHIDYQKNVVVLLNDTKVFDELLAPRRSAIDESIQLWGDPQRIYPAKITIQL